MRLLVLFLFLCIIQSLFAQRSLVDSLRNEIAGSRVDSVRMKLLDDLSWELMYNDPAGSREAIEDFKQLGDLIHPSRDDHYYTYYGRLGNLMLLGGMPDSAEQYYYRSLETEYAKQESKVVKRLNIQNNLATLKFQRGKFEEARADFEVLLEYGYKIQDTSFIILGLTNVGATYVEQGLLAEAVPSLTEAYRIEELYSKPTKFLPVIASNLCAVFVEQEDCESGEKYCRMAIELTRGVNVKYFATASSNWASCLNQKGEYEQARQAAQESISASSVGLSSYFAFLAIGDSYKREGELDSSLLYFERAIKKLNGMDLAEREASGLVDIADVLYGQGDFKKSRAIVQRVIPTFRASKKGGAYFKRALEINLLTAEGEFAKSLFVQEYKNLSDSLYNVERNTRINQITEKYEADKKEQQNKILELDRNIQSRKASLYLTLGIGVSMIALLLGILVIFIRRRNRQLSFAKDQIQTLNQDLNHRTSNYLGSIRFLLERQRDSADDAGLDVTVVNSLDRQILAFTKVQDKLKETLDDVNLKEYLEDFCEAVREALAAQGRPVQFNVNVADVDVKPSFAAPLALIINELATNSMKYARREDGLLRIALDAVEVNGGELRVFYRDGGAQDGEIDQRVFSSGQGVETILGFTDQLKGRVVRYGEESYDYEAVFGLEG